MAFGELLKLQRQRKGLKQRELAEKIRTTNTSISNWENSTSVPTATVVELLARELEISPFDLLGDFSVWDIQDLDNKDDDERTPEERLALSFALPILFQFDIRFCDGLSDELAATNIKTLERELQGFCWERLLKNGGKELLIAYDYLNADGKALVNDHIKGLLRIPSLLEIPEDGVDDEVIRPLDRNFVEGGTK